MKSRVRVHFQAKPESARSIRWKWTLTLLFLLVSAGCISISLFPQPMPLREKTVQGTAADKILLMDISGVISLSPFGLDRFSFVGDGDEIAPGVRAVSAPGHSPGHTGLLVESEGEALLALVDVLHMLIQFANPGWHHRFDSDGVLAAETRRAQLERAARDNLLTLFYHLPFPGLGRVVRQGDAYRWQAM